MTEQSATLVVRERERLVKVNHVLGEGQVRKVVALARKKRMSRSEVIRELLDFALERAA